MKVSERLFCFCIMASVPIILSLLIIVVVVAAAITDFRWQRIPNAMTLPTILLGVLGHGMIQGWEGLGFSLGGLGLGLGLLLGFYAMGGMAAGDVKLLAAVGSILGPVNVFLVFLMTAMLGGIYALGMMVHQFGLLGMVQRLGLIFKTFVLTGKLKSALEGNDQAQLKLRYGLIIALGTLTFQFWNWVGIG